MRSQWKRCAHLCGKTGHGVDVFSLPQMDVIAAAAFESKVVSPARNPVSRASSFRLVPISQSHQSVTVSSCGWDEKLSPPTSGIKGRNHVNLSVLLARLVYTFCKKRDLLGWDTFALCIPLCDTEIAIFNTPQEHPHISSLKAAPNLALFMGHRYTD